MSPDGLPLVPVTVEPMNMEAIGKGNENSFSVLETSMAIHVVTKEIQVNTMPWMPM